MSAGSRLKSWFREQKDASVSYVLESSLRKQLKHNGEVLEFQIDSKQRTAVLELQLKGERDPVRLTIHEYEVVQNQTGTFISLKRATASREWIDLLLHQFLLGRSFPVPEKYATWAKVLL